MTAAPNGLSIFPLALITTPQPPEYFVDNLNQLVELIATQCAAAANGPITNPAITGPAPIAVGSSATAAASAGSGVYLLNTAAGSTLTLPAATGTGNTLRIIVSTTATSNAHKILAASSSDFIIGISHGFTGSTDKVFASPGATNHSIQMPFAGTQPSGGFIGDRFEFIDIATNLWQANGFYQAGTTPTTPYSSATT